jgi:hypothetical protein
MKKRTMIKTGLAGIGAAIVLALPVMAGAESSFGPGASDKGPQDAGARCHPPGQTTDRAECK